MARGRDGGGREPWEQPGAPDPWESSATLGHSGLKFGRRRQPLRVGPEPPEPWGRPAGPEPWEGPAPLGHCGPKPEDQGPLDADPWEAPPHGDEDAPPLRAEPEPPEPWGRPAGPDPWEGHAEPDPWDGPEEAKPKNRKFRQESKRARPSDRLRREGEPPPGDGAPDGAADPKAAKEARKTGKAKERAEKAGAKLNKARGKLEKQKPPKRPGPVKNLARAASAGAGNYVHGKLYEVEHENVGTEAAHRSELVGEAGARKLSRFAKGRWRSRHSRGVVK